MKNLFSFFSKIFLCNLCIFASFAQTTPPLQLLNEPQKQGIGVKNTILAVVNGKAISVIDVMKKMDISFHKNFPHLADSTPARYQFYMASWQHALNEIIDSQLILADAEAKEVKIEDTDIRKEIEKKFGPNIMLTLDEIGLTYDEAWEMTKDEIMVQRMSWFRVNSKAFQKVTPVGLKKEYLNYCKEKPPKKSWQYRTISVRSTDQSLADEVAGEIATFLSNQKDIIKIEEYLSHLNDKNDACNIQLSDLYEVDEPELSNSYKMVLQSLKKNTFSDPVKQDSKNKNSYCNRLFYLNDFIEENAPAFESLYNKLEERILYKAVAEESGKYLDKLRKFYNYEQQKIELPKDFVPFVLE